MYKSLQGLGSFQELQVYRMQVAVPRGPLLEMVRENLSHHPRRTWYNQSNLPLPRSGSKLPQGSVSRLYFSCARREFFQEWLQPQVRQYTGQGGQLAQPGEAGNLVVPQPVG